MKAALIAPLLVSGSLLVVGCQTSSETHSAVQPIHMRALDEQKVAIARLMPSKAATTQPSISGVQGTVTFTPEGDKVHVTADLSGLPPGTTHGIHIHEKGDLSAPDLSSAGGHFNPDHHMHGGPTTSMVHAGDLGNVTADEHGNAKLDLTVTGITLGTGDAHDIVGKSVILHAKPDDLSSQPAGNSGPRIAGGVIELKP